MLAVLGGGAGLLLAYWATTLLMSSIAPSVPIVIGFDGAPDRNILLATMAFCSISTLIFGLGPALRATHADVLPELKDHTSEQGRVGFFAARNVLVVGQLALSLALVAAGGLFVRAAWRAGDAGPGYALDGQIVVGLDAALAGYDETQARLLYSRVLERVRALPAVEGVSLTSQVAFSDTTFTRRVNRVPDPSSVVNPIFKIVGPDYFRTLWLPIRRGRDFTLIEQGRTSAARVAIVDELLAARLWPGAEAVGRSLLMGGLGPPTGPDAWTTVEVVGVVPGLRHELLDVAPAMHVYVPFGQEYQSAMSLHVRVSPGAEAAMVDTLRAAILGVDDRLPVLGIQTLKQQRNASLQLWVVTAGGWLFTAFGLVALGIAIVGVYGVKSYAVSRRARELAIRIALGATPGDVFWLVLKDGIRLTAVGLAIGLLISTAIARALANMLYDVRALDPVVFSGAVVALGAAALAACYFPARRVLGIAPMLALRRE